MLRIITDSTSDISVEKAKEMKIDVVALNVVFNQQSYRDGIDINNQEFYERLETAKILPSTSQPSPEAFVKLFEDVKANKQEAIVLLLSSKISGTVQSAKIAKDLVDYQHIHIIDSLQTTISLHLLVTIATTLRKEGKDTQSIINQINELIPRTKLLAYVDTLDYLVKGGRLSKTVGMTGKMLHIKPIVTLKDGSLVVLKKARGTNKATNMIVDYLSTNQNYQIDHNYPLFYGYTGNDEGLELFISTIQEKRQLTNKPFVVKAIGSVIGTHAGPGAKAFSFIAKKPK